jgi:hypothetical protein
MIVKNVNKFLILILILLYIILFLIIFQILKKGNLAKIMIQGLGPIPPRFFIKISIGVKIYNHQGLISYVGGIFVFAGSKFNGVD